MKNKTKGLIAGVAGIALLTGGSTFALWSADADSAGGAITNGNLAITAGQAAWVDSSAGRTDAGHTINPATFRMVPGDTVTFTRPFDVRLAGDNLAADITLAAANGETFAPATSDLSVTYQVQRAVRSNNVVTWTDLGPAAQLGQPVPVRFYAADNANKRADGVVIGNEAGDDLRVVATLAYDVDGTTGQNLSTTLPALNVSVGQVRDNGVAQP